MKNVFKELSESRKLAMLSLSIEEVYTAGFLDGHIEGYENGEINERRGCVSIQEAKPLTPNQQRAAVIKQAREFVEFKKRFLVNSEEIVGGYEEKKIENPRFFNDIAEVEFVVNDEKRTIVAILRGFKTGRFISKGIAKCMPGDVFHADIGKAIALAKALEIEVPKEFTHAVQPDKAVIGMKVDSLKKYTREILHHVPKVVVELHDEYPQFENGSHSSLYNITDDTNAQYEVQS